jgi:protein involved in ribonucleotide reduction
MTKCTYISSSQFNTENFVQKQCSGHRIEPNPNTKRSAMVDLVVAVARVYLTEAEKKSFHEEIVVKKFLISIKIKAGLPVSGRKVELIDRLRSL